MSTLIKVLLLKFNVFDPDVKDWLVKLENFGFLKLIVVVLPLSDKAMEVYYKGEDDEVSRLCLWIW